MSPLAAPFRTSLALSSALTALGLLSTPSHGQGRPDPGGTRYYSTAAPPHDYPGVEPASWDLSASSIVPISATPTSPPPLSSPADPPERSTLPASSPALDDAPTPAPAETPAPADQLALATPPAGSAPDRVDTPPPPNPIRQAMDLILRCRERYQEVEDYTCVFLKKEKVDGAMTPLNVMKMKARRKPHSIYFQFVQPTKGREAIYVHGKNGGKAWVHDVGIGRLIAGTVSLDPRSGRAMDGNRHPINEAGLGFLIETVIKGWEAEMRDGETKVTVTPGVLVDKRPCTLIVSHHPQYNRAYQFHEVRVYIDHEHGLPVRFEAYDWPRRPGMKAELLEEYTYTNLKLNVGLTDHDFDPSNQAYSFGRF